MPTAAPMETQKIPMKKKKRNNRRKKSSSPARAACVLCTALICLAVLAACRFVHSRTDDEGESRTESVPEVSQSTADTESTSDSTSEEPAKTTVPAETTVPVETADTETAESTPPVTAGNENPPETNGGSEYLGKTSKGYDIERIDGVTYVGGILIANKTYPLPESYYPGGLTDETNRAFWEMQSAAAADGISLWCKSGFRSYIDQKIIYNDYVARDGAALADTYSARPGHSEHQSGMALDLNSLYTSFGDTPEGKWLAANCWKYGFIIRYMKEKESITGYIYEPWHVRYIGKENAKAVTESGLCLEEYLGITSSYN